MFWLRNKKIKFSLRTLNSSPVYIHVLAIINPLIRSTTCSGKYPVKKKDDFCVFSENVLGTIQIWGPGWALGQLGLRQTEYFKVN